MKLGFNIAAALTATAMVVTVVGTQAIAASKEIDAAIKARQSHMQLIAFNLGVLGGMAKGEADYNADAASAAASNLAALSKLDQSQHWPLGSDSETLGKEKTEALAAIMADDSKFNDRALDLVAAATAMEAAAGQGLDALQGAIGAVGKSCGGCHKVYRVE